MNAAVIEFVPGVMALIRHRKAAKSMPRRLTSLIVGACVACCLGGCGGSQTEPATVVHAASQDPAPNTVAELNQALNRIRSQVRPADPAPATPAQAANQVADSAVTPDVPKPASPEPEPKSLKDLAAEVTALRADFKKLQDSVNETLDLVVSDLHDENQRLRAELAKHGGSLGPTVTIGGSSDFDASTLAKATSAKNASPKQSFGNKGYIVVKEWGRTADEAKARAHQLGANVASLKGMICAAPAELGDDELADLGRRIRNEYAAYDNLNIDVFNDANAAQQFADKNITSDEHHVLSISRHKASGRDVVLLMRAGHPTQVPL